LQQQKILKDSNEKGQYEDFNQEEKEVFKPGILFGLKMRAQETLGSAISSHLQGTFYGNVQNIMKESNIKRFRAFCKFTGYSHETVYRKIKVARSYTRASLEEYPGVDLKALCEVANKAAYPCEALAKNHAALSEAGSDVHAVRKILDPKYEPVKTIIEPDGNAKSPDNRLYAEFFLVKAQIVIRGVSESDWGNFQVWFANQDCWDKFKMWKKLRDLEESEQQEFDPPDEQEEKSTQVDTDQLFARCDAEWNDPNAREDDGTINVAHIYGVQNLNDPGWLEAKALIKCGDNGAEHIDMKGIFSQEIPLTSEQLTRQLTKIRQDYPHLTDVMFVDDKGKFFVGTKIIDGNPVTRWRLT
jgi:hypothetical protein